MNHETENKHISLENEDENFEQIVNNTDIIDSVSEKLDEKQEDLEVISADEVKVEENLAQTEMEIIPKMEIIDEPEISAPINIASLVSAVESSHETVSNITSPELLPESEIILENFDDVEISHEHESIDFSELSKDEILEKLRYFIHETNVEETKKEIDSLKNQYYKNQKFEFELIKKQLKETSGDDVEIEMPKDLSEDYLKELMNDYRKRKFENSQKQEEGKVHNLKLKEQIIEKIKGLANSEESLNKTFAEFKSLQKQWSEIGIVPNSDANSLWKNYQLQIERFYDLVKINKELRDLDLKKNLELKVELCEKSEELLLETDILAAYKKLQEYHDSWKEIGPVPADKREEVWDRFSELSKKIRQAHQDHFETIKEERNSNYQQKIILCEKAETIFPENYPQNRKEWTDLSDQILELQKIWKTIGMVPNNLNNEIYDRFRAACNKFFDAKKEFFDVLNEEVNSNLQKKIELCISAESNKDNTDWKKTTEFFFDLQKKWKEIGPVSKKHSDEVWKRFRAACDYFFNAKSSFYSNIDVEQKENLKKKEDLIASIKNFVPSENQVENISKIKEMQSAWTEIGYVASSEKDRLYHEFRTGINELYDRLKLSKNSIEATNFNSKVEMIKGTGEVKSLTYERSKILQRIQELTSEINQFENNMGFFSSGSGSILKDFERKIELAQQEIKNLKEKKKTIDLAERELKKKSESNE